MAAPLLFDGCAMPGTKPTFAGAEREDILKKNSASPTLCAKKCWPTPSRRAATSHLYFEHTISNSLGLEDKKVDRASTSVNLGVGIRTVKGDQVGYGFTQELDEKSMMAAAAMAATIANGSATSVVGKFTPVKTSDYYPLTGTKPAPLASRLSLVENTAGKCFARSNYVIKTIARFSDARKRIMVVTSDGAKAEDLLPGSAGYSAMVTVEKNGRKEQFWFRGRQAIFHITQTISPRKWPKALSMVRYAPRCGGCPGGRDACCCPGFAGCFIPRGGRARLRGGLNRKKTSIYSTMMGQKVAEPIVTVVDDGTWPYARGSINFDARAREQKTVLVEKGILKSYLHDRISAKHYGLSSTGNGRRESYAYYPIPRMRNTYILPGPNKPQEIIESVKKGIYIQDVSNGQVNIGQGDFAFYVSQGRLIENGKLGRNQGRQHNRQRPETAAGYHNVTAVTDELSATGVENMIEGDDLIVVGGDGGDVPGGGVAATHLDHRIAMSFLCLGLAGQAGHGHRQFGR